MKKILALAAGLMTIMGGVHAQGSVTLYGIIDEGFNYNSNSAGSRLYNLTAGVLQSSRFGLRGTEDLGGGLRAVFVLENGFDAASGKLLQGGLMFGRQAYAGLSSTRWGTVTLGRQYDSVVDYLGPFEAGDQWGGYIVAHPGDLDNFNNAYRTNNTIKYRSNNYNGLVFGGTYSFGGVAGQFTQNQIWSLGANYANGPLALAVGYLNARTPSNVGGLFGNNTATTTASIVTTPVYAGYTSADTYQVVGAAGAYTSGAATIGATYSNIKFMRLGANGTSVFRNNQTVTFNNAEVNFKYQITPSLLAGAAFDYTVGSDVQQQNGTSTGGTKYFQGAVGLDYFLSKRTDVYLIGVLQKAIGTDSRDKPAVAAINNLTPSTSDRQSAVRIAIRHKF